MSQKKSCLVKQKKKEKKKGTGNGPRKHKKEEEEEEELDELPISIKQSIFSLQFFPHFGERIFWWA